MEFKQYILEATTLNASGLLPNESLDQYASQLSDDVDIFFGIYLMIISKLFLRRSIIPLLPNSSSWKTVVRKSNGSVILIELFRNTLCENKKIE